MDLSQLSELNKSDWQAAASEVVEDTPTRLFIGGEFVDGSGGVIESADGEVFASVSAGDATDIDRAVEAARASFRGGSWSRMEPRERMAVMYRFADLVRMDGRALAVLDTLDMGKPIRDMIDVDLPAVADFIQFCGECIDKIEGRVTNTTSEALHFVSREPFGVVGAISPWNYPMLMAAWKFAPALAAGVETRRAVAT